MKRGTSYEDFLEKAKALPEAGEIEHLRLILWLKFKDDPSLNFATAMGVRESFYPIVQEEWEIFITDIPTFLIENPTVWVVDGSKYTGMI